ncbi:MAG: hypothetical protein ACYDEI_00080 [Erysipelotrichaceae bacterium]
MDENGGSFTDALNQFVGNDQQQDNISPEQVGIERERAAQAVRQQNMFRPNQQTDPKIMEEINSLRNQIAEQAKLKDAYNELKNKYEGISGDTNYLTERQIRSDIDNEINSIKSDPILGEYVDSAAIYEFINAAARDKNNPRIIKPTEAVYLMHGRKIAEALAGHNNLKKKTLDTSIASAIPNNEAVDEAWSNTFSNVKNEDVRKLLVEREIAKLME